MSPIDYHDVLGSVVTADELRGPKSLPDFIRDSEAAWSADALSYIKKDTYENELAALIQDATRLASLNDLIAVIGRYNSTHSSGFDADKNQAYVVLYLRERFTALAKLLKLFPEPRGMHRGAIVLRLGYDASSGEKGILILADKRHCPFVANEER